MGMHVCTCVCVCVCVGVSVCVCKYLGDGNLTKVCLPNIEKLRLANYDVFASLMQLFCHLLVDGKL